MVCLPGEGTIHFSTNCPKIINIGESTPLEVVWIDCELTTSNFQPKRSSFECAPPDQAKQQGIRMLTGGNVTKPLITEKHSNLFKLLWHSRGALTCSKSALPNTNRPPGCYQSVLGDCADRGIALPTIARVLHPEVGSLQMLCGFCYAFLFRDVRFCYACLFKKAD